MLYNKSNKIFVYHAFKWLFGIAVLSLIIFYSREFGLNLRAYPQVKSVAYTFALFCLTLGLFGAFVSYFEYKGMGPQDGIVRRGPANLPVVSITFDDGPSPKYTPQILDVLAEKNVKATFFLTGRHIEKYPEVARRIIAEGHEVGNHTYSHKDLFPARRKVVSNQIKKCDKSIRQTLGISVDLFRPPRGLYTNAVRQLVVNRGYTMVLWTISSIDWRGLSPKRIASRIEKYIHNGAIILFHDSGALIKAEGASRENTVMALPLVIDLLKNSGYYIMPVGEMLALEEEEQPIIALSQKT